MFNQEVLPKEKQKLIMMQINENRTYFRHLLSRWEVGWRKKITNNQHLLSRWEVGWVGGWWWF